MTDFDSERDPRNKNKRPVEATDHEGSSHVSDSGGTELMDGEESLIGEVSEDVAPAVEEFMEQAAQQNEAAAEAVPDVRNKPGSYISFEHVHKSFGDFVVLDDVSFCVNSGETLCIMGRSGVANRCRYRCCWAF